MKQTQLKVLRDQVKQAYADGWYGDDSDIVNDFDNGRRCLSFITSQFMPASVAAELVKYIGGYNRFDPVEAREFLKELDRLFGDTVRVAIGREGSPALYFDGEEENLLTVHTMLEDYPNGPDELMYVTSDNVGPSDIFDKGTVHDRCDHEANDAPVPDGQEAEPENDEVIRAWWD